ncbi:MAG: DUF4240 domain-containing protein [Myxococcota bacterium]
MDESTFWELVAAGNPDAITRALARRLPEEIQQFELILRRQLRRADRNLLMGALLLLVGRGWSDDQWLYFRCALICRGQRAFERALADPDSLAWLPWRDDTHIDQEELLYVADAAHRRAMKRAASKLRAPRQVADELGQGYDGPEGTGDAEWNEADLPALLPQLWKRRHPT